MVKIIKEYSPTSNVFVLTMNTDDSSLEIMQHLFEEAKKTFPQLKAGEVNIISFPGRRSPRRYGIEFVRKVNETPEGYGEYKGF